MKKILILNIVVLTFLSFTACNQEEIESYADTDNIYFSPSVFPISINSTKVLTDSVGVSFGLDNPAIIEKIYKIPIRVQGKISNTDRTVKVAIDPSSTAMQGTHFKLPENIVMHAGREVDTIEVKVFRTPDIKNKSVLLVLNLEENDVFTTNMKTTVINVLTQKTMSYISFKLSLDDKLTQPTGWFVTYLGNFTAKKFFLMCDLMHLDPEMFNHDVGAAGISISDLQYYGNFMKRYLADQKAMGNIIYDENGTEMFFL